MKQRVITATILTVVLGLAIYFGHGKLEFIFSGLCVILSGIAAFEFVRISNIDKKRFWYDYLPIVFSVAFTTLNVMLFGRNIYMKYVLIFIVSLLLFYAVIYVVIPEFSATKFANHILTVFYTSIGFIAFAGLRKISMVLIIYLFLVTMLTDVFAYFIGIKFGKHRLAPKISPKKSIEGAIGGLAIGAILATVFAYFFDVFDFSIWFVLLLSVVISCTSQVGDLIASKFKREAGVKDFSNIFPGHGGVLDRFDSSMFAAVFLILFKLIF